MKILQYIVIANVIISVFILVPINWHLKNQRNKLTKELEIMKQSA